MFKTGAFILALAASETWASGLDRLMPTFEAAKIEVQMRKDGRALYVRLKNESSLVLTSGQVSCMTAEVFIATLLPAPQVLKKEPFFTHPVKTRLMPGKDQEIYLETPSAMDLLTCSLHEPRGREARWFELF